MAIYTIIDTEADGLITKGRIPTLLEVGYIQIDHEGNILRGGDFHFYKPEWNIENEAQAVHKLTREFLAKHEEKFSGNLVRLYELLENGCIIGKNVKAFDLNVCKEHIYRYAEGLPFPTIRGTLDVQTLYTHKFRDYYEKKYRTATTKKGTLEELVEMIGISQDEVQREFEKLFPNCERAAAHGALYDVYMTYLVLKYAMDNYGVELKEVV